MKLSINIECREREAVQIVRALTSDRDNAEVRRVLAVQVGEAAKLWLGKDPAPPLAGLHPVMGTAQDVLRGVAVLPYAERAKLLAGLESLGVPPDVLAVLSRYLNLDDPDPDFDTEPTEAPRPSEHPDAAPPDEHPDAPPDEDPKLALAAKSFTFAVMRWYTAEPDFPTSETMLRSAVQHAPAIPRYIARQGGLVRAVHAILLANKDAINAPPEARENAPDAWMQADPAFTPQKGYDFIPGLACAIADRIVQTSSAMGLGLEDLREHNGVMARDIGFDPTGDTPPNRK